MYHMGERVFIPTYMISATQGKALKEAMTVYHDIVLKSSLEIFSSNQTS